MSYPQNVSGVYNYAPVKLYDYKSGHNINLPSDLVRDSASPFEVGENLVSRIENGKIAIEKNARKYRVLN